MNNASYGDEIVKEAWKKLKGVFAKYKKLKQRKLNLENYLQELSPYVDQVLDGLETDILNYEKGFCNLKFADSKNMVEVTFVMLFKNTVNGDVEKIEFKRYVDKNIFTEETIAELTKMEKSFDIRKE